MILNSIEFIIRELKSLHNKFTNSNIRYEFCKQTNTHLIEVTPFEFYNSETYILAELDFEDLFSKNYPNEDILFISDESLNKITSPIFEIYCEETYHILNNSNLNYITTDTLMSIIYNESFGENNYALAA
jgi:hypothetical protein